MPLGPGGGTQSATRPDLRGDPLTREDIPVREKTFVALLYESAARSVRCCGSTSRTSTSTVVNHGTRTTRACHPTQEKRGLGKGRSSLDQLTVREHHRIMNHANSRHRLLAWIGAGVALAAVTIGIGVGYGAADAWGLGAILAAVYSATFGFIEHGPAAKKQTGIALVETEPEAPGPRPLAASKPAHLDAHETISADRGIPEPKERLLALGSSQPVRQRSLPAWPTADGGSYLYWHPALNKIEDVLAVQITDPSTIIAIAERVGINPGHLAPGRGNSSANYWHDALRRAWMLGREDTVCEVLRNAYETTPSQDISALINSYCRRSR